MALERALVAGAFAIVASTAPLRAEPAVTPSSTAAATPAAVPPVVVTLAPPPGDDARGAVAIGPNGEVYAPDGTGAWIRQARVTTADRIAYAGRAGGELVVFGEGAIYKLAPAGWSVVGLVPKTRSLMSAGAHAVGSVGRTLFRIDGLVNGHPARLATAPVNVLAIGSGPKAITIQTERGLYRVTGSRVAPITRAPKRVSRLVSDRWALVDGGALDLRTLRTTRWPAGLAVAAASVRADDRLVVVGTRGDAIELVTVGAPKLEAVAVPIAAPATPVGVAVDRAGRAVIAFRDGRLAIRDGDAWTTARVTDALPPPRPGSPPAISR